MQLATTDGDEKGRTAAPRRAPTTGPLSLLADAVADVSRRGVWNRTCRDDLVEAERRLLRGIEGGCTVRDVSFSSPPPRPGPKSGAGGAAFLHSIFVEGPKAGGSPACGPVIVLLPGFGMGAASYALALPEVARLSARGCVAVDLPGYGLSSRDAPFPTSRDPTEAEEFMVERLEGWRAACGFEEVALVGHSLGGYLAVAYAEKYPERVAHLVLASPCGVPDAPPKEERLAKRNAMPQPWRLLMKGAVVPLWERGWSPQAVVRWLGPVGKWLTGRFTERRFRSDNGQWARADGPPSESPSSSSSSSSGCSTEPLGAPGQGAPAAAGGGAAGPPQRQLSRAEYAAYFHHVLVQPGCSENMLSALLIPGACAKKPLHRRIPALQLKRLSFIYGENDWMDGRHTEVLLEKLSSLTPCPFVVHRSRVARVANAGHQLYLDNPVEFVKVLEDSLREPHMLARA